MTTYKGIEIEPRLRPLIRHMAHVEEYREMLQRLQAVWDNLALLGQLSGIATDMNSTRQAFSDLTATLLDNLGMETRRKVVLEMKSRAQVAVDILVRNLFERTADIGFLAIDEELRRFARAALAGSADDAARNAIVARFRAYVEKYSVYHDIVLLAPDGRILARLDQGQQQTHSRDPLVDEALRTTAPYVEHFRVTDLQPGSSPALTYAYRIEDGDGGGPLGVLCLCFRFEDETAGIFAHLLRADDWYLVSLLDAQGRCIASSDPQQLPVCARADTVLDADCRIVRLGGREYLAVSTATRGYQGYMGPGWLGHVMVPIEHAFDRDGNDRLGGLPAATLEGVMRSPTLFSAALQRIPEHADRIQRELNRSVWNGAVRQSKGGSTLNGTFSKVLLGEIANTGVQTRDVFARSIGQLHETVVSSILGDCEFQAALAIDIMDRNLYERANDCRWWALNPVFREGLAQEAPAAHELARMSESLAQINALYTVYDKLVVFDRRARVVAVSAPAHGHLLGRTLGEDWARRTLGVEDPRHYVVSPFEPSPLYDGRPTYIYAAPIAAPGEGRVVGGIAIVFDAEPQFRAMLGDAVAHDEPGATAPFAVFADRKGTVIASSRADIAAGSAIGVDDALLALEPGAAHSSIVVRDGSYHAVGARMSSGYREYKGPDDPYRNPVAALVFVPLGAEARVDIAPAAFADRIRTAHRHHADDAVQALEVATFYIGDEWFGIACRDVVEAVGIESITGVPGMPGHVRGVMMFHGSPVPVFDLAHDLRAARPIDAASYRQIVIVRAPDDSVFGILTHALAETPEIPLNQLDPIANLFPGHGVMAESVVRPDPAQGRDGILVILSVPRIRERLLHAAEPARAAALTLAADGRRIAAR
ncbi:chemotaxis protein CheW [Azoarcus olearius]|uniref:CheW-like domain-containing protein n=1 Tax=Azoarcus sp. (strain BH72) TaxID=418699 RepID=A1K7U4_AZOSB|nr:chemotaxis protein CheW [Azoarcus olearius]CAL94899.1 conserved hypothetical protein [Azoarcus olearius]